ncbi:MAG: hypothetical protein ABWY12_06360 [Burkholderiales bacterium]
MTTEKLAEGIAVQIGGALVFLISPGDVTALAGETLESTTAAAVAKLSTAIDETREARNLELMLLALARAAVATLVFSLALSAGCPGGLLRAGQTGAGDERPAWEHPGRLQRIRGADLVSALRGAAAADGVCAEGEVVRGAGGETAASGFRNKAVKAGEHDRP